MVQNYVLFHVALISFRDQVSLAQRRKIYDLYQTLDEDCGGFNAGIYYWKVDYNLDLRKGVHLVEVGVFRDGDALQVFRVHPKHKELTDILREIADWQIGDIEGPFPNRLRLPLSKIPAEFADESLNSN